MEQTIFFINQRLHINQDNLGSSGGWRRAIKYAIDNGFDYVWMMDDDGFPDKFALSNY